MPDRRICTICSIACVWDAMDGWVHVSGQPHGHMPRFDDDRKK